MPRTLSADFFRAAMAQETGACPVMLLTVSHPSLTTPVRVSTDPTERLSATASDVVYGTRSRGLEFVFLPLRITLPTDGDEGPQQIRLEIDNVHRTLVGTLRSIATPPTVTTEFVLSSSPDVVEASWPEFLLTEATYNATTISGTLALETLVREPFPAGSFDPGRFPGLF